jgi:hypothetical protein
MKDMQFCALLAFQFVIGTAYHLSTRSSRSNSASLFPQTRQTSLFAAIKEKDGLFGAFSFKKPQTRRPVERFFDAWNRNDTETAIAQLAEDCPYEDATFYAPFEGISNLKRQLLLRRTTRFFRGEVHGALSMILQKLVRRSVSSTTSN